MVITLEGVDDADPLGSVDAIHHVHRERTAAEVDRRGVADAVRLDADIVIIISRQDAIRDVDLRGIEQRGVIGQRHAVTAEERRATVGERSEEGLHTRAGHLGEVDARPSDVAVITATSRGADGQGAGTSGTGDRAGGAGNILQGLQSVDEERRAVQVQRALGLDIERHAGAGPKGIISGVELHGALEDGELAAEILLIRE